MQLRHSSRDIPEESLDLTATTRNEGAHCIGATFDLESITMAASHCAGTPTVRMGLFAHALNCQRVEK